MNDRPVTTVLCQRPDGSRLSMPLAKGREHEQLIALASVVPPDGTWWVENISPKALLDREAAA